VAPAIEGRVLKQESERRIKTDLAGQSCSKLELILSG
jgi:hypothetical protein